MKLAIWRKGNMFEFSKQTFSTNNAFSRNYYPNPKIPIKPNTYYTFVVEYSNLSITAGQTTMGFGIGYGESSYSKDIVYRQEYPNETSGKVVCSFNTKNCGQGMNLQFRAIRQNSQSTCSITWERAMVLEGIYTAENVPDFIPYTDGSPLVETKINTLAIWSKSMKNVLPKGYKQLEYIEADGNQYMKTGVTTTGNTRVVAKMMCLEKNKAGNYAYLFASSSPKFSFRMHWNNGYPYCTYGSTESRTFYSDGVGDVLNIDYGSGTATVNSYKYKLSYVEFTDGELQIFAHKTTVGTRGKGRVWMFKVYDGETLVRDYIPCIDPSGEVGLYDLVTASFYGNATSGSFIAGSALETKIKNIQIGGNS